MGKLHLPMVLVLFLKHHPNLKQASFLRLFFSILRVNMLPKDLLKRRI